VEGQQSAELVHGILIHGPVDAVPYVRPNTDSRSLSCYADRPREVMAEDLGYKVTHSERHLVGNTAIPGLLAERKSSGIL
jgi:hypothetical protein